MTAEEMWKQSGLEGDHEAWSFGDAPDELAELVARGIKTATCSALAMYEAEGEPLPKPGEYSVILDSKDDAVCIIETTRVYIASFSEVTEEHAFKEGEGDRSLEHWRRVHKDFFSEELASIGREFDGSMKLVLEEFRLVYVGTAL